MRALTSRDRHRDTRKAFVRHDMRTPSQRSVARRSKLDPQIDSESSTRIVISGVAEVDCAFLRKIFRRYFAVNFLKTRLNWDNDWKPTANAISLIRRFEVCRRSHALPTRIRAT